MAKHGKQYNAILEKVNAKPVFELEEAIQFLKDNPAAKFDETIELHMNLGVDPRHADQVVRGTVSLPHGLGKVVRVAVFAQGEKVREAQEAGADIVGGDDLITRVQSEGFVDFDVAISTPDLMAKVGKLGKVLGPRGLMPNPKSGTVTFDVAQAVNDFKAGKVEFRVDKTGIIHAPVGKRSFEAQALKENIMTIIDTVMKAKPSAAKGRYLKALTLTSTMGPGLHLDPVAASTVAVPA